MNRPTTLLLLLSLCLDLLLSPRANLARAQDLSRYINVTGSAEVKVAPDEVAVTLQIETTNKNIRDALKENDARLKKLIAVLEKQGVDSKHIQTGLTRVALHEPDPCGQNYPKQYAVPQGVQPIQVPSVMVPAGDEPKSKEYKATKTLVVASRDLAKLETLLVSLHESDTATVQSVVFQNMAQKKLQETVRLKAIQAARDKAEALTAALGQKIGKAIRIEESNGGYAYAAPASYGASPLPVYAAPPVYVSGGGYYSPEQITVYANVTVWFELP